MLINKYNHLKQYRPLLIWIVLSTMVINMAVAQSLFSNKPSAGSIDLTHATIWVSANDITLVKKAAALLQADMERVTGKKPPLVNQLVSQPKTIIIIGSLQNSPIIKELVANKKINIQTIQGKWEAYSIQAIKNPMPGVANALVIAGSDRRGTAFGVFELSKQMGISPWYWWADVPPQKKAALYFKANGIFSDAPKVKYRGIFINDEAPALSNWSKEKFGGFNHQFYEKVFELMLRLKANYLWPAMWGNAFYDDDPQNIQVAEDYGIVIGTSHHEPLMRAHDEWRRYGKGKWNYDSNATALKTFWQQGMQRATNEKIVSVGMRGDGDEPMTRETATALLERIVKDQRDIITNVTGKPANETPQLWALYKEVQDYYDKGMRVPDDITLLLCDDNWGNIRKLPRLNEKPRKGGYGIYYHFDYVGGPRNYKWLNTNPIPRVWEQMHLAWAYNARQIWIVNVGDIKPMEFPISFFLDYAWNPESIGPADLQRYTEKWATAQFGTQHAKAIAEIIAQYTKYNGRRKPELLNENTYHIHHYNELGTVTARYKSLAEKAEKINAQLPKEYKDAFFQLVSHPVKACANLQEMYAAVAWNHLLAKEKLLLANEYAAKAKQLYTNDSLISVQYHQLNNGKWNHMMAQTHIGYTNWQQPNKQVMPKLMYVSPDSALTEAGGMAMEIPTARNQIPRGTTGNVFYEEEQCVSIEADHFTRAVNTAGITWQVLPDHGRTGSAITAFPVTANPQKPGGNGPHLEYEFYSYSADTCKINAYFSPTLNFHNTKEGLQYAISVDSKAPQIVSINKDVEVNYTSEWNKWVADNIIIKTSRHIILTPGKHTLKYWMVNPGIVLQKLVIDFGGVRQSYLGPPETRFEK
jgi:Glycosyl hydrolase family 115/Gylcosyl hydrolase family 115 C-terminal domain/S-layer like family, C-terminal region